MTLGPDGALMFDGGRGHYQALASGAGGQLRFTRTTGRPPDGYATAFITLLTLDVQSNRRNNPTFVPLDFFSETGRQQVSTSPEFVCWTEQRVEALDSRLTFEGMGRMGLVVSGPAEKLGISDDASLASLMGLIEIAEGPEPEPASAPRQYINTFTFNNPPLASTSFVPTAR